MLAPTFYRGCELGTSTGFASAEGAGIFGGAVFVDAGWLPATADWRVRYGNIGVT